MQSAETRLTRPRLLIILNRFVIGGQAVDTIPLAWYLQNNFEILIIYGQKEKDEVEPLFLLDKYPGLRLKKISYLKRSINPLMDVFAFISVLYTIVTFKADIVHTHGAKSGFIGRLSAWFAGVPVIVHTFHGHFFHSYFSKTISGFIVRIERLIGKITTYAVALSDAQKNELAEKYKILPAAKIKIIPLGFAFDEHNNSAALRNAFRDRYGLQPDEVAVGIIGRIVAVKNHSFFNNVVQDLINVPPSNSTAFFIIGDGDLKHEVKKDLQLKKISFDTTIITTKNRVLFTSWLTDMYEAMNGLDIIVLTSLNEGTPLSIIEAQYFKRPVVSTNVGGVKDTMVDGKTGFLSESDDVTTFAKKLRLLIENEELRRQMGDEGYRFVSTRFSKQEEIEKTKELYRNILREKGKLPQ